MGALVLLASAAAHAEAQPTITIRAETRLELDVRRTDEGLLVSGALRDDLGAPLGAEDVSLEVSHAQASAHQRGTHVVTRVVTAGADGSFSTRFELPLGDYAVDAVYEGAPEHTGTRATRFFDLDRAHVTLRLAVDAGARIDLGVPEHVLTIVASSEAGGGGLAMTVTDETGRVELGHALTDADGSTEVTLESAHLGPPAAGRIVVRTPGDATRAEAQSELPVVRFRATTTTLALSSASLGAGEQVRASGTLTDGVAPLPREAITIGSGDRVIATVLTDETGAFEATIDESSLGGLEGTLSLLARFEGPSPWIPGSVSPPCPLTISHPLQLGWLWAIVPIFLAALVVRWTLRREGSALPVVRRAAAAPTISLGARRSLVAQRMEISGTARDAVTGEPLAAVRARADGREVETDATGAFTLTLDRDASRLRLEHPEYLPVETALALPHRGEHEGMQFRMLSRRAVSFAALRQVAAELAPDGEVALALTQREIFELLRARGASPPALPDLVARVEVACYAIAPPGDDEIGEIRRAAQGIVARAAERRPPAPSDATRR